MELKLDKVKLQQAVDHFYRATGFGINIVKNDLTNTFVYHITVNPYCDLIRQSSLGRSRCARSDQQLLCRCQESKRSEFCTCHAGLVNTLTPIIFDDIIVGYVMLYSLRKAPFSEVAPMISGLPTDMTLLESAYNTVEEYDAAKFESIEALATMLAKYIIMEDIITFKLDTNLERVKEYIHEHLDSNLSIQEISRHTHLSKSVLYKIFHEHLGCTINDYITSQRLKKACSLLQTTDMSLEEIAASTGFSNADYFGRVFKKKKGCTPSKYRKQHMDSTQ